MGNKIQINTFNKGMNMDLDYSIIDTSQYQYADNIRIMANDGCSSGVMQNIEGFDLTNLSQSFVNEKIIHVNTIRDWAIVFTKINGSDGYNIYRINFEGGREINPESTKIGNSLTLDIPSNNTISSVCKWESDNNVKIYWCDGKNKIRVLNVAKPYTGNVDALSILPKSTLPPLFFDGLGVGSLQAGKYQYCYQLFNARGSETSTSVLSPIIPVARTSGKNSSQNIIGSPSKENTGKSIILETTLTDNSFTRAKIISLYYASNTSSPIISVIDDIPVNGNVLHYEDKGGTVLDELTVDEFNALVTYSFAPKVLESKDNMLFAANVTENTWDVSDVEFDARAFRCDNTGQVLLKSNSSQKDLVFNINDVSSQEIPSDHDCVCPFNVDSSNAYKYTVTSTGEYVLGGKGKNIEYKFIVTDLIEDDTIALPDGKSTEEYYLACKAKTASGLNLYGVNADGSKTLVSDMPLSGSSERIINYADSEIDSKLRSHTRGEIYRFAIVLYNEYNMASSAKWIADIKMPEMYEAGYETFTTGKQVVLGNNTTDKMQLVTHPLGVQFIVKNLPSNVTGFEIVRCERTISDRSILMQGIVSQVLVHDSSKNMLVPMPYLTYATDHGQISLNKKGWNYIFQYSAHTSRDYYMFISPELCVNRENSNEVLSKAMQIKGLCNLRSSIESTIGTGQLGSAIGTSGKPLANARSIKWDGKNIHTTSDLEFNKEDGWAYPEVDMFVSMDTKIHAYSCIRLDCGNFYGSILAKYYNKAYLVTDKIAPIEDITMAVNTEPFDLVNEAWKNKATHIGSMNFYNWMYDSTDTEATENANNTRKMGPHGVCAVFKSTDMHRTIPYIGRPGAMDTVTVALCNLIQNVTPYGGNSYSARQNSTYISTGVYKTVTENNEYELHCFGGDTYIGVLDYANGMMGYDPEDYQPENSWTKVYSGAYIPVESSINLSMRGDSISTSKTYEASSGYSNHFVQNDITQIGDIYTQNEPLYRYNDAYSAQPVAKKYVSKSIYNIDNLHTDTRVLNSEPKTNNEVTDSWTKFKVANYLDVDTRFGSINNMKLFNNMLFFWQTDAFGTLAVNERSLIQDNNIGSLTLGTGGVLTRYDYLTTKNGSKEDQLRVATKSDGAVYWYDSDRNEICGFDNQLQTVSKLKGVQSYLNSSKSSFLSDPVTTYDKKYNEVLFTLENKTLVFNEQLGAFTSFYTFKPDWYVEFSDKLYTFNNLKLFKYNAGNNKDLYTDKDKIAYIRFIVNKDYVYTKTFDNVEYGGDFTRTTNFNNIYFQSKRQTSYTLTNSDIDYREDTYKFAIPRNSIELNEAEEIANKSYRDRMKGKYLICHYKYDCNKGNTFKVPYISTAYRYSMI